MSSKKPKQPRARAFGCSHKLDKNFPQEGVYPFMVGRCVKCSCMVAVRIKE